MKEMLANPATKEQVADVIAHIQMKSDGYYFVAEYTASNGTRYRGAATDRPQEALKTLAIIVATL